MALRPSAKRLLVSVLYFGLFVCFVMASFGPGAAGLSELMLLLGIGAAGTLGVAAFNGVRSSASNYLRDTAQEDSNAVVPVADAKSVACLAPSSNALIFSAMHTSASLCLLMMDILNDETPLEVRAPRMTSTLLWMYYAVMQGNLAFNYDRRMEANPGLQLKPCGMNRSTINFVNEVDFLASGMLYLTAVLSDTTISPYKALGGSLWLIAGMLDVCKTYNELGREQKIIAANQYRPPLPVVPPAATCKIDVIPDTEPAQPAVVSHNRVR